MTNSTPIDETRVKLQARALERIYEGSKWLTGVRISELGIHNIGDPVAAARQWKEEGQLISLEIGGQEMYPAYMFGTDSAPLPIIQEIISALHGWDPVAIAGWFESTSSFLSGKRPRELVAKNPSKVLRAAQDAVMQMENPN